MELYSERFALIDTENAFKIGPHIARLESQGPQIVKFNLGEPDFDLPEYITEEVKRQLDNGNTHYCDPQGVLPFREAIARHFSHSRGIDVVPEQVVVFPGAKPSIALAQHAYLNPGDEVIYPSPGFPIYESVIPVMDAVPVPLILREEHGFSFTGEELSSLITPRTKMIFLNFPSNPTGGVASATQLEEIASVILERCSPNCRIFSDEIYEDIIFDDRQHASIAAVRGMQERTIILSGLSKSFSWTGGRIGYAAFPTAEEAEVFKNLNINYFSCVPPFLQMGGAVALTSAERDAALQTMVQAFQQRRDFFVPALNEIAGVRSLSPAGAFYVFPNIAELCQNLGAMDAFEDLSEEARVNTSPSTLFQMFALYRHGVALMDRRSFGKIQSEGQHYLRISIATGIETLTEGAKRLTEASRDSGGFKDFIAQGQNLYA